MEDPWEEAWERPVGAARAGPTGRERWRAIVVLALASGGFLVTVVWPVVTAFR